MNKIREFISGKNILFISPVFYEYQNKIRQQLEQWGNTVFYFTDRYYGMRFSIVNNYFNSKIEAQQGRYYAKVLKAVENRKLDYVFILKGYKMPVSFISELRKRNPGAVFIMHQWDSLVNYDYRSYLGLFDRFYSFDPADCRAITGLRYLPNFYLPEYVQAKDNGTTIRYDLSFIGTVYDDRLDIIQQVIPQMGEKSFYHYCFMPPAAYFKRFILKGERSGLIKTQTLPLDQVFEILRQSRVVLDIHSEGQTGYTYRAIDAIAAGKKLITTNQHIKQEQFYDENNILIIDRKAPRIRLDFWDTPFKAVNISDYSLEAWLMKIFC